MKEYFDRLLKLCDIAIKEDEVPVAALIVRNNKIISESYNSRIKTNSVLNHAEINAIEKASEILNDWRLDDCDLYVTLKPCDMCIEVIKSARIKNVYYLANKLDSKKKYDKTLINDCSKIFEDYEKKYLIKMSSFFAKKREK